MLVTALNNYVKIKALAAQALRRKWFNHLGNEIKVSASCPFCEDALDRARTNPDDSNPCDICLLPEKEVCQMLSGYRNERIKTMPPNLFHKVVSYLENLVRKAETPIELGKNAGVGNEIGEVSHSTKEI